MSAHTPGPWTASPFSSVVGCAITAQPDPKQNTQLVASTYTEANAALIAAAPDLLKALDAFTRMGAEVVSSDKLPLSAGVVLGQMVLDCGKLIARARGGE